MQPNLTHFFYLIWPNLSRIMTIVEMFTVPKLRISKHVFKLIQENNFFYNLIYYTLGYVVVILTNKFFANPKHITYV